MKNARFAKVIRLFIAKIKRYNALQCVTMHYKDISEHTDMMRM